MIISITGPSGSGKSTIGDIIKHRFKNVMVIDTDEIDDDSFFYLLENNPQFKEMIKNNTGKPYKIHEKLNIQKRDDIILNNPTKNIVFVGLTVPMTGIIDSDNFLGYFLDTPLETNFRRINHRTIRDTTKNSSELQKLYLDTDQNINLLNLISLYKFKIRQRFPVNYDELKENIEHMKQDISENKYKIMTGKQILSDLESYLEKSLVINKNNKSHTIIHISGSQGAGKTHMGDKLQLYYGDLIYVKDLDELSDDFGVQSKKSDYQDYIDEYVNDHSDKPIIFTGLDAELCLGDQNISDTQFYDLHTSDNFIFFIDIEDEKILKQRFYRQIQKLYDRKEYFFTEWLKNPLIVQQKLIRYVDISSWKEKNSYCKIHYQKRGYEIINYDLIFEKISDLLKKIM